MDAAQLQEYCESGVEASSDCRNCGACDLGYDTFGGNIKAYKDYANFNIEGAELTHMGQSELLGTYPIHFHLASDAGYRSVIRKNSIHHCFNRCVTVHGTHGVTVQDNVAHDTLGHCYYIEDGGEKYY